MTNDTLLIHFEKGSPEFKGVYQAINQMFLEQAGSGFESVNREQDLDNEGLRKAKLSYNPVGFIKKYKISGIFYKNNSRDIFLKGIRAILDGRMWLSRRMLSDCISLTNDWENRSALEQKILSSREKVILKNVASGASNQEIADNLEISVHTVKTHLYKIYRKLNVTNRLQASLLANTGM